MDLKQLVTVVNQISKERNLEPARVVDAIQDALATAYRREYGKRGEVMKAQLNPKTGDLKFWQVKEVVDDSTVRIVEPGTEAEGNEEVAPPRAPEGEAEDTKLPRYNPERHIMIEEARAMKPDAALGELIEFPLETRTDFGRIAAQAAKQVILQKFREAEKESVMEEFKDKAGTIVSGSVHRFDRGNVYVDLGRVSGVLFPNEAIPGEHYRQGDRLRFYVLAVQEDYRGQPEIVLSRSHPTFIAKLFELEVPEIAEGIVEIKAIIRETGSRTKIAVHSSVPGVDPVGSCVGQRGTRVMAVTNELGKEKIDIIE
ncbi:MAG: transcription termination factor NusA, partial [Candidatus Colwellbacteria bacterium]|nr:transcription termination factor NusA [Candidatus Colwellbacteria bacterium]